MTVNFACHACEKAAENLSDALDTRVRLPDRVFSEKWVDFHLFNSDWIFEGEFVGKVRSMMSIERASCAYLANLDRAASSNEAHFMIHHQTSDEAFRERLRGAGPGDGWIYDIDRFGCISDTGSWCIYCERSSELAIIGFKSSEFCRQFGAGLAALHAGSVISVVAGHADFELSSHLVSDKWKENIAFLYR